MRYAFIAAIIAVCVNTAAALPGSGTAEDPWRIQSLADFNEFAADANYWSGYTRLETDINLSGLTYTTAVIAPNIDDSTGGFQGTTFTGIFDGNGCKITGLTINDGGAGNDYLGLFGRNDGGQIKNLGLEEAFVNGDFTVGGLVGWNGGGVSNCYSNGYVNGTGDYVGGLVGACYYAGIVSNCYSGCDVSTTGNYVGGLVGGNYDSVSNCYSAGDVTGISSVGGLAGYNFGNVSNCHSSGDVSGTNDHVGGLVGENTLGSVSNCYSTGDVNAIWHYEVGGLLGDNDGSISNCFWDVNTQSHGVTDSIGNNWGTVTNVAGLTTAQMQTEATFTSAGWDFMGESAKGTSETWQMPAGGYPVLSFFRSTIPVPLTGSGTANEPYLIGDANELGVVNWYPLGCCFKLTGDIDLSGINWSVAVVAAIGGCFDGSGYRISNMQISGGGCLGLFGYLGRGGQLQNLSIEGCFVSGSGHYIGGLVGANIDSSISNCYSSGNINGTNVCVGGLVGANYYGIVSNCYSICEVNGGDWYVGGLVGVSSYGSVSNCYSAGTVNGGSCVGGLVGLNYDGSVSKCYSTGKVIGDDFVGGLLGGNDEYGTISNCYSACEVSGINDVGGLVGGITGGSVSNCYSTGDVSGILNYIGGLVGWNWRSSVSNCFWDTNSQTYGVIKSIGCNEGTAINVVGLTTDQMQTESTFTSSGWDFLWETINGPNDIWVINDGFGYPKLLWKRVNLAGWYGVDFGDYARLASQWRQSGRLWCNRCDIIEDGRIDFSDFAVIAKNWQKTGCDSCGRADLTDDGNVTGHDLYEFANCWLEPYDCFGADIDFSGDVDTDDLAILCQRWLLDVTIDQ